MLWNPLHWVHKIEFHITNADLLKSDSKQKLSNSSSNSRKKKFQLTTISVENLDTVQLHVRQTQFCCTIVLILITFWSNRQTNSKNEHIEIERYGDIYRSIVAAIDWTLTLMSKFLIFPLIGSAQRIHFMNIKPSIILNLFFNHKFRFFNYKKY